MSLERRLRLVSSLVLALALLPGPGFNWAWGLNQWGLFPLPLRLAVLAAGMAAVWWPGRVVGSGGRRQGAAASGASARRSPGSPSAGAAPRRWWIGPAALGAGLLLLWFFWPTRALVLGDNSQILSEIDVGNSATPRSPLYALLVSAFVEGRIDPRAPAQLRPVQLISSVCGLLFLLLLADMWRRRSLPAGPAAAALLVGGYLVTFQGYVEAYALFLLILAVWIAALLARPGWWRNLTLVAAQILAIPAYSVAFLLLPVTGWTLLPERLKIRRTIGLAAGGGALFLTGLLLVAPHLPAGAGYLDPRQSITHFSEMVGIFAPRPWRAGLGRLLWEQPLDMLNGWLLAAPVVVIVWLALLGDASGRRALGRVVRTPLGAAALTFVALRPFLITPLGPFLDWDVYASMTLPLIFLTVRLAADPDVAGPLDRTVPALLAPGLLLLIPFMAMLLSPELSNRRLESYLEGHPRQMPYVASHVQHRIGHLLALDERRPEAAAAFEKALALYPREEFAFRAGLNWMMAGQDDKALADFDRAIELNPAATADRLQRGGLRLRRRDWNGAREDFEAVLRAEPQQVRARLALATIARHDGDDARAGELLTGLLPRLEQQFRRTPGDERASRDLSDVLLGLERYADALPLVERLARAINRGRDWYNLGLCRRAGGDTVAAVDAFQRALVARPPYEAARRALEEMKAVDHTKQR